MMSSIKITQAGSDTARKTLYGIPKSVIHPGYVAKKKAGVMM
jgi:hypothetical protein